MRSVVSQDYSINFQKRREAMQAIVGIRKDRREFENPEAYVRKLRRGSRFERISNVR